MSSEPTAAIHQLAILRTLVGYLGEKEQLAWWDSNFLSSIGLQFLQINFPRTALSAAIHSTAEAARRLHDQRIGKSGVYHLFRLPAALEEDVHHTILDPALALSADLIKDRETALGWLKDHAAPDSTAAGGAVLLGSIRDIQQPLLLEQLAALYHLAFLTNTPCFPYFSHE